MRWLILLLPLCFVAFAETAHAQDPIAQCAPRRAQWERLRPTADVQTIDRLISEAAGCTQLQGEMRRHRDSLTRRTTTTPQPQEPTRPANPCASAQAEWQRLRRDGEISVLRTLLANTPTTCEVLRAEISARINALQTQIDNERARQRQATAVLPGVLSCQLTQDIVEHDRGTAPEVNFNRVTLPPTLRAIINYNDAARGGVEVYISEDNGRRWERTRYQAERSGDTVRYGGSYRQFNEARVFFDTEARLDVSRMSVYGRGVMSTIVRNGPRILLEVRGTCTPYQGQLPTNVQADNTWTVSDRGIPRIGG